MSRDRGADDRFIWDNENNILRVGLADTEVLRVDTDGVVVPGACVISGNITTIGSVLPFSGVLTDLYVTNTIHASGTVNNPVGSLILSSSSKSYVMVSGNLAVWQNLGVTGSVTTLSSVTVGTTVTAASGALDRITCQVVSASQGIMVTGSVKLSTTLTAASGSVDRVSAQVVSASQGVQVTGTVSASSDVLVGGAVNAAGAVTALGDINAAGGFRHSYIFVANALKQGTFTYMTASQIGAVTHLTVPTCKAGSIIGISIKTLDSSQTVKSGSLSASVMINGANAYAITMETGSDNYIVTAKDNYAFAASNTIGVSLTASDTYLSEPNITSASFIVSVFVEC